MGEAHTNHSIYLKDYVILSYLWGIRHKASMTPLRQDLEVAVREPLTHREGTLTSYFFSQIQFQEIKIIKTNKTKFHENNLK